MPRTPPGRTVTVSTQGEPFQAFVPAPLPPAPPVQWDASLRRRFDDALVALGRAAPSAWALHEALQRQPVASAAALGQAASLAPATVNTTLVRLQGLGIVDELTERRRGRVFAYSRYVALLNDELDGTGP